MVTAGCHGEPSGVLKPSDDAQLANLLDSVYERRLSADPVLASRMGARRAGDKPWFDLSLSAWDRDLQSNKRDLDSLRNNISLDALSSSAQIDYLAFEADLALRIERHRWRYHLNPINQIVGPHLTIAGTLLNNHPVLGLDSAQDYIERLRTADAPMSQLVDHLQERRKRGINLPPAVVERLIDGAESILGGEDGRPVVLRDFEQKVSALAIQPKQRADLLEAAAAAYDKGFAPGYQLLLAELGSAQANGKDAGVWSMPDGPDFYEFLVDQYTTADLSGAEIHSLGLAEVARIQGEMDRIREKVNFSGDLRAFFAHLKTDPKFYYPDTDEGRRSYLNLARQLLASADGKLEEILPYPLPQPLQVRRIESFREKSAPAGFYVAGNPDNGNTGTVYLGMGDMSTLASYDLPWLLFHEGIPGHHLQSSVMLSGDVPSIRQYYVWWSNTAYTEGWALYAEYLADELGLYEDDYARFGRLAGELWRACRLVVDTGLHLHRWTRDEAIHYLNRNTASSELNNARAVDRYLAVPGQALSFKIGMQFILDLRNQAEQQLGDNFDLADFHAQVLEHGALPLQLLRQKLDDWIAVQLSVTGA